jgi:hypothetical protein
MDVISWCEPPEVGLDFAANVMYGMLCNDLAPTLYYRSIGTKPILLRRGNILGRPYVKVMTYNALILFICIKLIRYLSLVVYLEL